MYQVAVSKRLDVVAAPDPDHILQSAYATSSIVFITPWLQCILRRQARRQVMQRRQLVNRAKDVCPT